MTKNDIEPLDPPLTYLEIYQQLLAIQTQVIKDGALKMGYYKQFAAIISLMRDRAFAEMTTAAKGTD